MAEKVKRLGLERDYRTYLYYLDKEGNVVRQRKGKRPAPPVGPAEIVVPRAVTRDNQYLYYLDRDGDISRSRRARGGKKESESAA